MADSFSAFLYRVFDLVLNSNAAIPGLTALESGQPDVTVDFGSWPPGVDSAIPSSSPAYKSPYHDGAGVPIVRIWNLTSAIYRLSYVNGLEFVVDHAESKIWSRWPERVCFEDAASFLLGPVLGILLRLRGRTCLHASAVAYKDRAIVFAGSPGAGKSTLAAALSRRGLAVLSDDIVLLEHHNDGHFKAIPAHPFLSLWPESVELIDQKPEELTRIFSKMEKRRLPLDTTTQFESRPRDIGAIYVLDSKKAALGTIEKLTGQDALVALITASYGTYVLDVERRARELSVLSEVVNGIPVFSLPSERGRYTLDQHCELILRDYDERNGNVLK